MTVFCAHFVYSIPGACRRRERSNGVGCWDVVNLYILESVLPGSGPALLILLERRRAIGRLTGIDDLGLGGRERRVVEVVFAVRKSVCRCF